MDVDLCAHLRAGAFRPDPAVARPAAGDERAVGCNRAPALSNSLAKSLPPPLEPLPRFFGYSVLMFW